MRALCTAVESGVCLSVGVSLSICMCVCAEAELIYNEVAGNSISFSCVIKNVCTNYLWKLEKGLKITQRFLYTNDSGSIVKRLPHTRLMLCTIYLNKDSIHTVILVFVCVCAAFSVAICAWWNLYIFNLIWRVWEKILMDVMCYTRSTTLSIRCLILRSSFHRNVRVEYIYDNLCLCMYWNNKVTLNLKTKNV